MAIIGLLWLATWNRATANLRLFNSSKRGWSWLCESINPLSWGISSWLSSSVVVLICQQPLLSTKISSNITWEKTLSTNWIQLIIDYRRPNYDSTRLILRKIQWLWRSMAMLLQGWKIRWHWRNSSTSALRLSHRFGTLNNHRYVRLDILVTFDHPKQRRR